MASDARSRLDAFTLFSAAAFAGGNLFIGLSMGAYWLSFDASVFMTTFFGQWLRFLATIMPLLLMSLYGLVVSARLDRNNRALRRLWHLAIGCWIAACIITAVFHLPRTALAIAVCIFAMQAVFKRRGRVTG